MNRHLIVALAATSCLLGSTVAKATTTVSLVAGSNLSYTYGAGADTVDFTFTLPKSGSIIVSLATGLYGQIALGTVTLNGDSDDVGFQVGTVQGVFVGAVTPDPIIGGELNTMSVQYEATTPGTFYGNYTFTAVPEPATWAMMLAGLGMIGVAIRRRHADRVTYA